MSLASRKGFETLLLSILKKTLVRPRPCGLHQMACPCDVSQRLRCSHLLKKKDDQTTPLWSALFFFSTGERCECMVACDHFFHDHSKTILARKDLKQLHVGLLTKLDA